MTEDIGRNVTRFLLSLVQYVINHPTRCLVIFVLVFFGLLTIFAFKKSRR